MPISVQEKLESRATSRDTQTQQSSLDLAYFVTGTDDDAAALAAVEAYAPISLNGLARQSVRIEPVGPSLWDATASYATSSQPEAPVYAFETGGGTQHITQSRQTVGRYATPGKTAPDFQGAIGVTSDNVDGVDITVPVYQFSETHTLPAPQVTSGYRGTIFSLTGKTNSDSWKGYAPGEVLFMGATGSRRGTLADDPWEITFRFAASPNATGISVGQITGIEKRGWDYMWIRYADDLDESLRTPVKRPVAAYVERVYDSASFGALGI